MIQGVSCSDVRGGGGGDDEDKDVFMMLMMMMMWYDDDDDDDDDDDCVYSCYIHQDDVLIIINKDTILIMWVQNFQILTLYNTTTAHSITLYTNMQNNDRINRKRLKITWEYLYSSTLITRIFYISFLYDMQNKVQENKRVFFQKSSQYQESEFQNIFVNLISNSVGIIYNLAWISSIIYVIFVL